MEPHRRRRNFLRFSVSTLLVILTCVCCYLAGRIHGYKNGRAAIWNTLSVNTVVYDATDLLESEASITARTKTLDELASTIRRNVIPASWAYAGGSCTMEVFPKNGVLVVAANNYVHEGVQSHLTQVRESRTDTR